MSYGVGHRRGSDLALLWLWCSPVATTLIGPLAWEPPYAVGAALEKTKKEKNIYPAFNYFEYMPRSGTARSYDNFFFFFEKWSCCLFCFCFFLFRAIPVTYGSSRARD